MERSSREGMNSCWRVVFFVSVSDGQVPLLITTLSFVVDGQERPVTPSSSAPPESCCAAGTALHGAQSVSAPHSSH